LLLIPEKLSFQQNPVVPDTANTYAAANLCLWGKSKIIRGELSV